jgi:hypothetical protein
MIFFKWIYKPNGKSPVQADGRFLGYYFYFRSKWDLSTIDFYKNKEDWENLYPSVLYLEVKKHRPFIAGFISNKEAKRLIYKGCFLFFIYKLVIKKHQR